ncbi:MAG: prepilin-type N-terminal cleavage/methylation domain-containing protein [Thermoguttaceae bacterium]|nr:prepilin-type N-terminal cleavage/methylation domain-containing protein [Thermoguttaceae bacterium]
MGLGSLFNWPGDSLAGLSCRGQRHRLPSGLQPSAFGPRPSTHGSTGTPHFPLPTAHPSSRTGLTLVELLVVVTILVMLTAVVIPVLTPSLESRRMREAARQVNLYLNRARSMAMEKKRPVGVWLQRRSDLPQAVTQLFLVEELFPASVASNARIDTSSGNVVFTNYTPQRGDYLQVNFQGPFWQVTTDSAPYGLRPIGLARTSLPVTPPGGLPIQVRRMGPDSFHRSLAAALELPAGVAVDTTYSGVGDDSRFNQTNAPGAVLIMFSSKGEIDSVGWFTHSGNQTGYQRQTVQEPIYLLVGKLNRIPQGEDGQTNLRDLGNLWVVVMPQTGVVRTAELAANTGTVADARRIARQQPTMGGK